MTGLPIRCTMVSIVVLRGCGARCRMLLLRRHGRYLDGVWSYVAGHIQAGESGTRAALRELAEETGLTPERLYATSFCEQFHDPGSGCIQVVPAFVARVSEAAEVRLNGEHSAARWVTLTGASKALPFGSQRDLVAHVRREFVARDPHPQLALAIESTAAR